MATQTVILASSTSEGASLILVYDDVTLIGSAAEASVSASAVGPMTVNIVFADGTPMGFVVQPNQFNRVFPIPANKQPHGVLVTNWKGQQAIDWGFQSVGISF